MRVALGLVLALAAGCPGVKSNPARSYVVVVGSPPVGEPCTTACGADAVSCTRHANAQGQSIAVCWYADGRGTEFVP